jgi:hypothetical protein
MSREICEDRSQVEALHGKPEEAEVAAVVQLLKWSLHFPTKYVLKSFKNNYFLLFYKLFKN